MVCLNSKIPVNLNTLENVIYNRLNAILDNELDHLLEKKTIEKVKTNVLKILTKEMKTDNFIYNIIHEDNCGFKHRRGKNDGKFCCRKSKTNIKDGKKDYLCSVHSKKHIPKTKIKNENKMASIELLDFDPHKINNSNTFDNLNIVSNEKIIKNNNLIFKDISLEKNNINKNSRKKINNKKLNINFLEKRINYYSYNNSIICKYGKYCNNRKCMYKHINSNILLNDFINNNSFNTRQTCVY